MFQDGREGSLVDDDGHFFKPFQAGDKALRERQFYQTLLDRAGPCHPDSGHAGNGLRRDGAARLANSWAAQHAILLRAVPTFYGIYTGPCPSDVCSAAAASCSSSSSSPSAYLVLEDITREYKSPSILDIKVGYRTWYAGAAPEYISRCKATDAATTQAELGFKLCGLRQFDASSRGNTRRDKKWCKALRAADVPRVLTEFAHNGAAVGPTCVYCGSNGAIAQLTDLLAWFRAQREFCFYSSSVLIMYEGCATTAEEANVSVRLIDFAHTFAADVVSETGQDDNFTKGLESLISTLELVASGGDGGSGATRSAVAIGVS